MIKALRNKFLKWWSPKQIDGDLFYRTLYIFLLWALFICIERGKQATRWLVHTVQSPNLEEAINL